LSGKLDLPFDKTKTLPAALAGKDFLKIAGPRCRGALPGGQ
jgi:hypothetical protein